MKDYKVLSKIMYDESKQAISSFSGDLVEIIGEQVIECEGRILDQYLYNIVDYTPANGRPFMSLKSNLVLL